MNGPAADRLWPALLAAAGRPDSGASPAEAGIHWHAGRGWQWSGPARGDARELFALFKPLLDARRRGRSWVIALLGQSLDGCVATRSGDACFINGERTRSHLHRLRALCDAVIVGAGTVANDDPRLTTRRVAGPNATRVLLDPTLRLAAVFATAQVFNDAQSPTLWLCDARWHEQALALAGEPRVLAVPGLLDEGGVLQPRRALAALYARGLVQLLVEGGCVTVSRFLAGSCLERLHLVVAPLLIGDGRPGLRFNGADRLADCARPASRVYRLGDDLLWDLDLRAG